MNERFQLSMLEPRPHGTRTRYQQGCRCLPCRAAAARYQSKRMARKRNGGEFRGLVPTNHVRRHLRKLSRWGIGIRTVSATTDIHTWKLHRIRQGKQQNIRADHARLILAVDRGAIADGGIVPMQLTLRLVGELRGEGFTMREIAVRAGISRGTLRRKPHVQARTARKVEKFYNRVMAEAAA